VASEIRKWEYAFTEHLSTSMQNQVSGLRTFIHEATTGMKATVGKGLFAHSVSL
jgi:hypothetical protein